MNYKHLGTTRPKAVFAIIAQNGTPITWQTVSHDTLVAITGVGQVVETAQTDALNHVQKTRTDGAGRTLETVDALSNVTTATFDAAGNQLSAGLFASCRLRGFALTSAPPAARGGRNA